MEPNPTGLADTLRESHRKTLDQERGTPTITRPRARQEGGRACQMAE